MGIGGKKFIQKYGLMFSVVFIGSFFLFVSANSRVDLPTFPGDIVIGPIYLPFASAAATGAFVTIVIEIYKTYFK